MPSSAPSLQTLQRPVTSRFFPSVAKSWILAACLQARSLEREIPLGDSFGHRPEHTAKNPLKLERQSRAASRGSWLDGVASDYSKAGPDTDRGEASSGLDRRDLPHCRRKLRLTDQQAAADLE